MTAEDLIAEFWKVWAARDHGRVAALVADDVVYTIHVPTDVLPFAGRTVGKRAMIDRLLTITQQFEVERYDGVVVSREGDTVRGLIAYRFRHRASGDVQEGTLRHVAVVTDDLIRSLDTYRDVDGLRAQMRLISWQ
jgi:ketosteroid isomerase-like protein